MESIPIWPQHMQLENVNAKKRAKIEPGFVNRINEGKRISTGNGGGGKEQQGHLV